MRHGAVVEISTASQQAGGELGKPLPQGVDGEYCCSNGTAL